MFDAGGSLNAWRGSSTADLSEALLAMRGKPTLLDPGLFRFPHFTTGISGQLLQNVTLGGAMIALGLQVYREPTSITDEQIDEGMAVIGEALRAVESARRIARRAG